MNEIIYFVDQGLIRQKITTADYQLKDCETEIVPENILEPAKIINGKWISATAEEHSSLFNLKPSPMHQQLAALAYQQMTAQQTITNLQAQNAQMAYQLMTAQGGTTA
ncbi:hypothetical protein DA076_10465 [Lactiplantibacillus plantarum]|uniref:hypothetical protein n=1 Tax=Lactiplantibacillus plantarum TaxID=1590 RepID=UPI000D20D117|nr:hypothetical protein [Lactiplantibacillus plantarum]AVW08128.1 hypothetical protein DA076_10465 [Lactiplantibacillus plantarum]